MKYFYFALWKRNQKEKFLKMKISVVLMLIFNNHLISAKNIENECTFAENFFKTSKFNTSRKVSNQYGKWILFNLIMLLPSNYKNLVLNAFDLEKVQRHIASTMKPSELTKKIQKKKHQQQCESESKKTWKSKMCKTKSEWSHTFFSFCRDEQEKKKK
jgi:hypothetical protein